MIIVDGFFLKYKLKEMQIIKKHFFFLTNYYCIIKLGDYMTITEDTPISALMNYETVSSLCGLFNSRVDSFKENTGSAIESEMLAGLSAENCMVDGEALLEEEGLKTITYINNIDTGITSKIEEQAKQKRIEELIILREKVTMKIDYLQNRKNQILNKNELDSSDIAEVEVLQKDIDKYEKKLEEVNAEYGKLG